MTQILHFGGSKDHQIIEDDFHQDKQLRYYNVEVTSNIRVLSGGSNSPEKPQFASVETYHMDAIRIDGKFFAYATSKSIQGFEIIKQIKLSGLKPID